MQAFWVVLTGIAIFLLGMKQLEESLRAIAGRSFKLFLRRQTANKFKAVAGGAAVTAVVQGSSVVNLLILAFAGAGVLPMANALAVLLGSNLGTTIDSWIVASLGFQASLEKIAFPVTGCAGLLMMLTSRNTRAHTVGAMGLGFGFLFIGLDFMKSSMAEVIQVINLSAYVNTPLGAYLLAGLLITLVIQSSFATVALVLSLLYANGIAFLPATAVVLGAEIGTTGKLFLASLNGVPVKKRLALGNFLINFTTAVLVLLMLRPLAYWIQEDLGIHDNLIALVFFQSMVNVISILLFFPVLGRFGKFLEKRYRKNQEETLFIHKVSYADKSLAIEALANESRYFLLQVTAYGLNCFSQLDKQLYRGHLTAEFLGKQPMDQYEHIKYQYGTIHNFYLNVQVGIADADEVQHLDRHMATVRNGMYAAKSMKDARFDEQQLRNSSNDVKYGYYLKSRAWSLQFFERVIRLLLAPAPPSGYAELSTLYHDVVEGYLRDLQELYRSPAAANLKETEISTLINYNRELYTSYKSMVLALKDCFLSGKDADYFDDLPGFIR